MNASAGGLTTPSEWDTYWDNAVHDLPIEITRDSGGPQLDAILDVFDRSLEPRPGMSVLEIGGAPGQYLAYVHRTTGCECAILDYSPHGCAVSRENFALLGIPMTVYERDMFDPAPPGLTFDVVYSLGVVEHFDNLDAAVAAHTQFLRRGGLLILGMPNFRGVNGWFAKRINEPRLHTHNLDTMRFQAWDSFEQQLDLHRIFRGYVGGFEPTIFTPATEPLSLRNVAYRAAAQGLVSIFGRHGAALRRFNHPATSGYMIGVWRLGEEH